MKTNKNSIIIRLITVILLIGIALLVNRLSKQDDNVQSTAGEPVTDFIEVHFIDVGQGDAILVEAGGASMLIDAGENNMGMKVVDYLKSQEIDELDYVIATHPHGDHIGGLDIVLDQIPTGKIIMPNVSHTTKTYEDVLDVIEGKNLTVTEPSVGDRFDLGAAAFTIVAPNSPEYDELNNYSIGIKLTYKNTSFLFLGDAEELSEEEMLSAGPDLTADVLKLSHHGSRYSSTDAFLDAVNPSYAVISVGEGNDYGHPHAATMQKIKDRKIALYRTDKQKTVVLTSEGRTISANADPYEITEEDLEE